MVKEMIYGKRELRGDRLQVSCAGTGFKFHVVEGKANFGDDVWEPADETKHRFFRVKVELK